MNAVGSLIHDIIGGFFFFLEAKASYSTGLAGGFFTLKITNKTTAGISCRDGLHVWSFRLSFYSVSVII